MASITPALDIDRHYPLTEAQISQFRRDGFIKLKHVLSPEVLAHYGKIITAEVRRLNTLHLPMEQRTTYQKAFLQVMNLWAQNDDVREFCFGKKLARMAAELMGVDGVRIYHDQALYKEPGGGITPWHADQYYWPISNHNSVTAWIPLQETPMELGPLAFSVGSHQFEMGRELEISDDSEKLIGRSLKDRNYPLLDTPFDLGEVSFHYGWTFHRAGPNTSDRPRAVMTIIYIEDGIRLVEPKNKNHKVDWDTWMPGVKVGEVVDSPLNPLIYSAKA